MTKNDWFSTNLIDRNFNNLLDFQIKLCPYESNNLSFKQNSILVANEIIDKYGKIYLAYSGGLDSEYVLRLFTECNLPITPIILNTPFNQSELLYAKKYCGENDIKCEVITLSKNEFIDSLKRRTLDRGFFSLLGGIPLLLCDELVSSGGKLLTGYGDPFTIISGNNKPQRMNSMLEFSEWDYYLDVYDGTHPSGFLTYDISLFLSMIREISYETDVQTAKATLYNLTRRQKIFWDPEFYSIFREIMIPVEKYSVLLNRDTLLSDLKIQ